MQSFLSGFILNILFKHCRRFFPVTQGFLKKAQVLALKLVKGYWHVPYEANLLQRHYSPLRMGECVGNWSQWSRSPMSIYQEVNVRPMRSRFEVPIASIYTYLRWRVFGVRAICFWSKLPTVIVNVLIGANRWSLFPKTSIKATPSHISFPLHTWPHLEPHNFLHFSWFDSWL